MIQALRRLDQMKASTETNTLSSPTDAKQPSPVAHMLWTEPCVNGTWSRVSTLPNYAQIGLWTALNAGYEVHIWTYSDIFKGLPKHASLHVRRASDVLPRVRATAAIGTKKWVTAHIADWVRLLAAKACPGKSSSSIMAAGAHVVDVDAIHFG